MESAPTIHKAITIKKTIEFTSKQGLRTRNVWLTALSVSLTTATSPRVRGRFDEQNVGNYAVFCRQKTMWIGRKQGL